MGGANTPNRPPSCPRPWQASAWPRWVTMRSSACTPEKGPVHVGSELPPRAGWGGRDGNEDSGDKVWGCRDWGTHGGCLPPPPRAVLSGKEGWVGWWVGDGSPHSFDQQVSPGCGQPPAQSVPYRILVWSRSFTLPIPLPLLPHPLLPFLISHIPQEAELSGEPLAAAS